MIAIIGGGIGGLTAAVALQRRGIAATVYEQAPALAPLGFGILVPPNALQALARLGLVDAVRARGVPMEELSIRDERGKLIQAVGTSAGGQRMVAIHRAALHEVLAAALAPGTLRLGHRLAAVSQDEGVARARFEDGVEVEGELLVGADGWRSVVRGAVAPEARLRYAGQACYRGLARVELPPEWARRGAEYWAGENRFGFAPVGEGRVYWYAPFSAPEGWEAPEDSASMLAARYAAFPAPVPALIAATESAAIGRTDLYDLAPLSQWHAGRIALLGDAAHAMTPNLGQGGAQAIEDGVVLAECIAAHGATPMALAAYAARRRPRVAPLVAQARQLGALAHLRPTPLRRLRDALLRAVPARLTARRVEAMLTFEG